MEKKRMANPKNFCKEAEKLQIKYNYLIEAKECVGGQNLCRMFNGKSSRGGGGCLSSATIDTWLETFKYVEQNPDKEDNEQYTAQKIEPKQEYFDFVNLIKIPISDETVKSWEKVSQKSLGDVAEKYGITLGIRNSKSIKTLHKRMLDMVERRKQNIWNEKEDEKKEDEGDFFHASN